MNDYDFIAEKFQQPDQTFQDVMPRPMPHEDTPISIGAGRGLTTEPHRLLRLTEMLVQYRNRHCIQAIHDHKGILTVRLHDGLDRRQCNILADQLVELWATWDWAGALVDVFMHDNMPVYISTDGGGIKSLPSLSRW